MTANRLINMMVAITLMVVIGLAIREVSATTQVISDADVATDSE